MVYYDMPMTNRHRTLAGEGQKSDSGGILTGRQYQTIGVAQWSGILPNLCRTS